MTKREFQRKFEKQNLKTPDITQRTYMYSGEHIKPVSYIHVQVKYIDFKQSFPLYVVRNTGTALLGRDLLKKIQLDWKVIKETHSIYTRGSVKSTRKIQRCV